MGKHFQVFFSEYVPVTVHMFLQRFFYTNRTTCGVLRKFEPSRSRTRGDMGTFSLPCCIVNLLRDEQLLLSLRESIHQCIGINSGKSVRKAGPWEPLPRIFLSFSPHDSAFKLDIQ
jgi:hypothetical protein